MTWYTNSANQAAGSAVHAEAVTFVDMDFPSGHLYLHTWTGLLTWGGHDWAGVGQLGAIEAVKEDAELRPNAITLALSGVDSALMTAALTETWHGRPVRIYQGFLDVSTLALVATPETVFTGLMDYPSVALDKNTSTITVHCESELARWQRPRGLLNTHESQQLAYAGDRFFDLVPAIQTRTINWTRKGRWGAETGLSQSLRIPTPL